MGGYRVRLYRVITLGSSVMIQEATEGSKPNKCTASSPRSVQDSISVLLNLVL